MARKKKSRVFEIKVNGKWQKTRATSMQALSKWADTNGIEDWRVVGMLSRAELEESKSLEVVA